ncbi:hypothetical protein CFAM422_003280 [Trichoderma lentiforme]|uniref:Secreted protein n=1 Tax=Trichoderma lentiforme TaxID=1567552 RepID=A0A9P5CG76_9HYPO|nr:hypothetical protein CFAM422_003280 [Trichoderma lentiforme]
MTRAISHFHFLRCLHYLALLLLPWTWLDKTGQDKARQGKTRQDKAKSKATRTRPSKTEAVRDLVTNLDIVLLRSTPPFLPCPTRLYSSTSQYTAKQHPLGETKTGVAAGRTVTALRSGSAAEPKAPTLSPPGTGL